MQSSCEMASARFGGSCAQQFRGSAKILHVRLPDSRVTSVIRQFITTVLDSFNGSSSGLTLGSFQKQRHPDPQIISGTVIRKKCEDLFN